MIADWYSSALTSVLLIPSQQCSLSGRRTALMFHVSSAVMLLGPVEPSNVVPPCVGGEHMYSEPARLTPSSRTVAPLWSLSRLPWTCSAFAAGRPANGSSPTLPPMPPVPVWPPEAPAVPVPAVPLVPAVPAVSFPFAHPTTGASKANERTQIARRT